MVTEERKQEFLRFKQDFLKQRAAQLAEAAMPARPEPVIRRRDDDPDPVLRREVLTEHVDALEQWKRDGEAFDAARRREDRNRARITAKAMHDARQHSDAVTALQADVEHVSAGLLDVAQGTTAMGEAIAGKFDEMVVELAHLRERQAVMDSRLVQAEQRARDAQAELNKILVAQAVLKSELADLKLEIKQAIYDRRVAEAAPMLGGGVN
jgi:hypothetical protein